jgi:hypothetical protein
MALEQLVYQSEKLWGICRKDLKFKKNVGV